MAVLAILFFLRKLNVVHLVEKSQEVDYPIERRMF